MNKELVRKIKKYLKLRRLTKEAYNALGMKRSTLSMMITRLGLK